MSKVIKLLVEGSGMLINTFCESKLVLFAHFGPYTWHTGLNSYFHIKWITKQKDIDVSLVHFLDLILLDL